jgi:biotin carboxyl carrier protein
MKLFNSIKAGVAGRIAEIRAENAALVEYNEVLVVIEAEKG